MNVEWFKKHGFVLGVGVILVIVVASTLIGLSNNKNTGADWESKLNAQYLATQTQLDATVKTIKEQFGVAQVKSDKLDQVLQDAVKGRYEGSTSAKPGSQNALFSALVEAYPDLTGLNVFDKVQDSIASGREAFRQEQNKMLDMLRGYDHWRNRGLIHPFMVRLAGFPSHNLQARIGTDVKYGAAARERMFLVVTSSDVQQQFKTGQSNPIDFGSTTTTTK